MGACVGQEEVEDGPDDAFVSGKADGGIDEGSPEALGVLRLVNDANETAASLKSGAHLTTRVANNIFKHRCGADGVAGTADDDAFDTLARGVVKPHGDVDPTAVHEVPAEVNPFLDVEFAGESVPADPGDTGSGRCGSLHVVDRVPENIRTGRGLLLLANDGNHEPADADGDAEPGDACAEIRPDAE